MATDESSTSAGDRGAGAPARHGTDGSDEAGPATDGWSDPDVRTARTIRAARDTLIATGVACLALGFVAVAIGMLLDGIGRAQVEPGLTVVAGGQLLILVAAALAALALRTALRPQNTNTAVDQARLLETLSGRLGWCARGILAWCVAATAVWAFAEPGVLVTTAVMAAVTAQPAALLAAVRRRLRTAVTGHAASPEALQ